MFAHLVQSKSWVNHSDWCVYAEKTEQQTHSNTTHTFFNIFFTEPKATGWTVRGSNPGGGEIFSTCPDRPWGPPSLLYNGYWVCFLGVKQLGCGVNHPPSSSARVKERVELYLYSPSGPLWPVLGRTLPLPYLNQRKVLLNNILKSCMSDMGDADTS
jgi:hypothetical protein